MHRVLLAALLAAVAVAGASVARAAAETITIEIHPLVGRWALELDMEGVVSSGRASEEVVVEERSCGSDTFRYVFTTHTLAGGRWDLRWSALENSAYRARWRGTVSRTVSVQKRPGVTLRNPRPGRYVATVFALRSFRGRAVTLERFDPRSRRWSTVRRATVTGSGAASAGTTVYGEAAFAARVPRNTLLRLVTPATDCYLAGFSNMLRSR